MGVENAADSGRCVLLRKIIYGTSKTSKMEDLAVIALMFLIVSMIPRVEGKMMAADTVMKLQWLFLLLTAFVLTRDREMALGMAAVQLSFILGHYYVRRPEGFFDGRGSHADLLFEAKEIRKMTSVLGCDIMWHYKQSILEWLDDPKNIDSDDDGNDVLDCSELDNDFQMFEKSKYTKQIDAKLEALGIGSGKGSEGEKYRNAIQKHMSNLIFELKKGCKDGKILVSDVKTVVNEVYAIFCDPRESDKMAEVSKYSSDPNDPNDFPFPLMRMGSDVVGTLGDDFKVNDLTDPVLIKIREWVVADKPGGLGVKTWNNMEVDAIRSWAMKYFKGSHSVDYKGKYDAWLAS